MTSIILRMEEGTEDLCEFSHGQFLMIISFPIHMYIVIYIYVCNVRCTSYALNLIVKVCFESITAMTMPYNYYYLCNIHVVSFLEFYKFLKKKYLCDH